MFKKHKASVLGATLVILGIILVSALSFSLVSIQERKASLGENKSNQAFQTANTGSELVLQDIKGNFGNSVDSLSNCDSSSGLIINSSAGYRVQLQDSDGNQINCNDSSKRVASVKSIKSVGVAGNNQRAIEVAVAGGTCIAGQEKLIEKNDASYSSSGASNDYETIKNYVYGSSSGPNRHISGFLCKTSTGGKYFSNPLISINDSYKNIGIMGQDTFPVTCDGNTSHVCGMSSTTCSGGWIIYGACTCDTNNCPI
jgi:hypothetical protein